MRTLVGILLSPLPRRWRAPDLLEYKIPWQRCAILSGIMEILLGLLALIYWYSHSVTSWAAAALDSALKNGAGSGYDPHVRGLTAVVIWWIHPLTWLIFSFFIEGMVRLVAAVSTEQVLPLWPLALTDWIHGIATRRPREGDALHTPPAREQLRCAIHFAKEALQNARNPEVADELVESRDGPDLVIEIHSSRRKRDWEPPRIVRIADQYYRLEFAAEGKRPRPFIYSLRRLPAGVPGRNVLVYVPPAVRDSFPSKSGPPATAWPAPVASAGAVVRSPLQSRVP
jgi:hypothetical protein